MAKAKDVPLDERIAVSKEICELLGLRNAGRRMWTQATLGARCGVSQEAIRQACDPAGVWPSVREGILEVTGFTMSELLAKHRSSERTAVGSAPHGGQQSPGFSGPPTPAMDRALALNAIAALQKDGFDHEDAKHAVANIYFAGCWVSESDLYRQARDDLETTRSGARPRSVSQISPRAKSARGRK